MAAKKKRAKEKPKPESLTAVKLVVHQDIDKIHPGTYRYVVTGVIVSDHPLDNFPADNKGELVMEDVEQGTFGLSRGSMLHIALSSLPAREAKLKGLSADQKLMALQRV